MVEVRIRHCYRCHDKNFLIECECGCGGIRVLRKMDGRIRRYLNGHTRTGKKNPWRKTYAQDHPRWKGGIHVGGEGYVFTYNPNHPYAYRGYIYEHRMIVEKYLSECIGFVVYIHPSLDIHHVDKNKLNNDISNLRIVTKGEHSLIHKSKIRINKQLTLDVFP